MIVILYVMDSLRPDFLSCYGYKKETSPNIDKIAHDGVIFNNAFAQSTWTRPSGASILSSTYPSVHRVITVEDVFLPGISTLPEQLKKQGFKTIAISSMGNISPDFGFGRGFDYFIELYKEESVLEKRRKVETKSVGWQYHFKPDSIAIPTSEDINEFLFPLLEKYIDRDLFIFIWSLDTHDPYFHRDSSMAKFCLPSKEILWHKDIVKMKAKKKRNHLQTLYEDMIYYNDYHIGALAEKLKKLDLYDQTFFIITSDHGEAFGEHGVNSHAGLPYDEQIRVPLLMKFPNSKFYGQVEGLVQLIDLYPTILTYLNIRESNDLVQGKNLIPLISENKEEINDFVFNETQLNIKMAKYYSIRDNNYKYINVIPPRFRLTKSRRLIKHILKLNFLEKKDKIFNLISDPVEKKRIDTKKEKGLYNECNEVLNQFLLINDEKRKSLLLTAENKKKEMDEKIKNQLKALGYLE